MVMVVGTLKAMGSSSPPAGRSPWHLPGGVEVELHAVIGGRVLLLLPGAFDADSEAGGEGEATAEAPVAAGHEPFIPPVLGTKVLQPLLPRGLALIATQPDA